MVSEKTVKASNLNKKGINPEQITTVARFVVVQDSLAVSNSMVSALKASFDWNTTLADGVSPGHLPWVMMIQSLPVTSTTAAIIPCAVWFSGSIGLTGWWL